MSFCSNTWASVLSHKLNSYPCIFSIRRAVSSVSFFKELTIAAFCADNSSHCFFSSSTLRRLSSWIFFASSMAFSLFSCASFKSLSAVFLASPIISAALLSCPFLFLFLPVLWLHPELHSVFLLNQKAACKVSLHSSCIFRMPDPLFPVLLPLRQRSGLLLLLQALLLSLPSLPWFVLLMLLSSSGCS